MAKLKVKHLHTIYYDNRNNSNMFLTGTLSFQASKQIRSYGDLSVCASTIKYFLPKKGDKYCFKKKSKNQHENPKSVEATINEVFESITTNINYPASQEPLSKPNNEDDLIQLFDQLFSLMLPRSDRVEPVATVDISKAFLQGKETTYQVTIQNLTIALQDTGANISVVPEKCFKSLLQKPKLSKVYMHKVTSASRASLGLIWECDLTFQLRNRHFMNRFIVLQDLHRNLILYLNW